MTAMDAAGPARAAGQAGMTAAMADLLDRVASGSVLLARLFLAAPDERLLTQLATPQTMDDWPLASAANATARRRVTAGALAALGDGLSDCAAEYQRLFIGPDHLDAPPYESVYCSEEHLVFGAETVKVRAAYTAAGLATPSLGAEPDDHIGLECDYVATVAARTVSAWDAWKLETADHEFAALRDFLRDHLLYWGPVWADDLLFVAGHDLYRGAAGLAGDLFETARALL